MGGSRELPLDPPPQSYRYAKLNIFFLFFRAVWFDEKSYPQSWELNPTEGPCRVRKRCQRGHLGIAARFLKKEAQYKLGNVPYLP